MLQAIIALSLWFGSILGGSGPPGTVDVWVAVYAPYSATPEFQANYYRLASYQKGSDAYRLCDLSGQKRNLSSSVTYQQPGTPPFSVYVPSTLQIAPYGCAYFDVAIFTGKLGAWTDWDVFVIWEDYGKAPLSDGWVGPAE